MYIIRILYTCISQIHKVLSAFGSVRSEQLKGANPGNLEMGASCERRRRGKKRKKLKSECQISVFLASGSKIEGLIVS